MTPAAATQPMWSMPCGEMSRLMASYGGDDRGEGDHGDHEEAGDVFGSSVAIGVAAGRWAAGETEREEQWDRGERVAEVVDRVGEQCDRS